MLFRSGEDSINHTSRNEEISITTGKAFDLVASSQVRNQKTISQRSSSREIHVNVKNNSLERKEINVVHQLSGNTKVSFAELRYGFDELKNTVTFTVSLDPGKEQSFFFRELTEW